MFITLRRYKILRIVQTHKPIAASKIKDYVLLISGKYYAIGNTSSHLGGPPNEGTLERYEVEYS